MESDRPSTKINQLLNQYVYHMESEIGRSGKTFHQILSEFLKLKTDHPTLAAQADDLEISGAEALSTDQFEHFCQTLRRLQNQRNRVLQSVGSIADHPWSGIADPDHKAEEFEALQRTIRFVTIQLNKLWVEIQSVPLFLNAVDHASITEIERVFRWILASPNWNDMISQPKVIPALAQLDSRRILLDFARDVRSVRVLRERIISKQSGPYMDPSFVQLGLDLLSEGILLVQRYQLRVFQPGQLDEKIRKLEATLTHLDAIQRFFSKLAGQYQFPIAKNLNEARKVYFAANIIKSISSKILPYRLEKILDSRQLGKIESWKEQAKSLLDMRKKLDGHFRVNEPIAAEDLRKLANTLASAGALRTFSASYQGAVSRYQNLLKKDIHQDTRRKKKETPVEMTQKLLEWAVYLDQLKEFEGQSDLRTVFGSLYKSIDTDFSLASQTNLWANQIRSDLKVENDSFGKSLYDFIVKSSELNLGSVLHLLSEEESRKVASALGQIELEGEIDFSNYCNVQLSEVTELKKLQGIVVKLGIRGDVTLDSLEELKLMTEEMVFLCRRMESNTEIKHWLKTAYRGIETDLNIIDQCLSFVQFIESAEIPESLRTMFISAYGPQRLFESRSLVSATWPSLEAVKESFQKLEIVTHGQTRGMASQAIPGLLARLQQALRQPSLFLDWVEYVRIERDAKSLGLSQLLDHYDKRNLVGWSMDQVFEFAFLASLLKKAIAQPGLEKKPDLSQLYSQSLVH